ncbi:chromosome segregation ATPase [Sporocytophaga myxococcoides]|uniref:Chromosome segregation ATPase n=1 Tax=Sporocytophaga myxococcoides TaxID=153721 RepID=A0A098LGY6_9BACT|nr:7TM diverse intracellular signaling domain-containing protein [Sporocytophaga myxococcoides]GAL85358.1 chromosome segregation ATPase [Sporocytophaga myxococcoides]
MNNQFLGFLILLAGLILPIGKIYAEINLTDQTEDLIIQGREGEWMEDFSGKKSFLEIASKGTFSKSESGVLRNFNPSSVYWIRFNVKNNASKDKKWVLESLTPNIKLLDVWIPDENGVIRQYTSGLLHQNAKSYPHKNYVFDLPSALHKYTVYARIYSPNDTGLEFKIRSQHYFTAYALYEYFFLGIYYGCLLLMLIYNLLLYLTNKERVYIFYSVYVTACIFLSLTEDGLGVEVFWKGFSSESLYLYYYIAPLVFLISSVFYARAFLNLKINFPQADKALLFLTLLYTGYVGIEAVRNSKFSLPELYIVPFVLIYIISIYIYIKGYKAARFFILGYTVVFISLIILQLRLNKILEPDIFSVYVFNYGILAEAMILSFALGDRLKMIRKEKAEADKQIMIHLNENNDLKGQLVLELKEKNQLADKVNRELDMKVQERTKALQQKTDELALAHDKLELYSKKLADMNIKLDLDNWKLKTKVKEERKARIVSEEISIEEFLTTFPDQSACLRYLEELKWAEGYSCRKCRNTKFSEKNFSRKCTKCNYIESPTSNTLFHGIKIPLNKAFYLLYCTNLKTGKYTLDELSLKLEIGKNTCWEFRKRVQQRQEEKRKTLKIKETENWELLIMD